MKIRIRVVDVEIEGSDEAVLEGLTAAMDAALVPVVDAIATLPPKFYPCGCSARKVALGRCDVYAPGGTRR